MLKVIISTYTGRLMVNTSEAYVTTINNVQWIQFSTVTEENKKQVRLVSNISVYRDVHGTSTAVHHRGRLVFNCHHDDTV